MSVANIPEGNRLLKCALPILITHPEAPDYPGINGTCFAIRRGRRIVFVTAGHVVNKALTAKIEVATGFEQHQTLCQVAQVVVPRVATEDVEDACDLGLLIPADEPTLGAEGVVALVADEVVDMARSPPEALFAFAGYPREGRNNGIDYENRTIRFELFHGLGTYVGPSTSMAGCHTLKVVGGPANGLQGFSGSPVIRIVFDRDLGTKVGLAGLAIRGGSSFLHFVDVTHLLTLLATAGY